MKQTVSEDQGYNSNDLKKIRTSGGNKEFAKRNLNNFSDLVNRTNETFSK